MKKKYLETGRIINTRGVHGELKVEPWADSPSSLLQFGSFYIDSVEHKVVSSKVYKDFVYIQFGDICTLDEAVKYKNKVIFIDRDDAKLPEGSWFIQDILGFSVVDNDSGDLIGTLDDVLDLPSGNIFMINGKSEHLVPNVPEFIKKIDFDLETVYVHLIEGM